MPDRLNENKENKNEQNNNKTKITHPNRRP